MTKNGPEFLAKILDFCVNFLVWGGGLAVVSRCPFYLTAAGVWLGRWRQVG